ncbi:hypothetical protein [Lewinella sp. 4G2]|uniref:hypothetical protein n=1 Tax=Lewinella sp. 4G2 TaxID=1803372 RepID=UPI0007B4C0E0|nr:hypothetical protein [Lewinella sp. 4G2]OAV45463.1 hypothetical protein A3850_013610 [Lewinella sp. 4G2]
MAQFDPFEQEFRQRASGIRRTPSPRAWNRLEHRLDRGSRSSTRLFGIRPWMIAALFLIVAGTVGLSVLTQRTSSPLAQRSQSIEDLDNAFAPSENFDAETYRKQLRESLPGTRGSAEPNAEFRGLTVNAKYRS